MSFNKEVFQKTKSLQFEIKFCNYWSAKLYEITYSPNSRHGTRLNIVCCVENRHNETYQNTEILQLQSFIE